MRQLGFNSYESEILFDEINTKQDGAITLSEWTNKVYEDGGPLQ